MKRSRRQILYKSDQYSFQIRLLQQPLGMLLLEPALNDGEVEVTSTCGHHQVCGQSVLFLLLINFVSALCNPLYFDVSTVFESTVCNGVMLTYMLKQPMPCSMGMEFPIESALVNSGRSSWFCPLKANPELPASFSNFQFPFPVHQQLLCPTSAGGNFSCKRLVITDFGFFTDITQNVGAKAWDLA